MKYFLILLFLTSAAFADDFCTGTVNTQRFCILMRNAGVVNEYTERQFPSFSAMLVAQPELKARFQAWLAKNNGIIPGKKETSAAQSTKSQAPAPKKKLDAQFDRLDSMMHRSDSLLNAKLKKDND